MLQNVRPRPIGRQWRFSRRPEHGTVTTPFTLFGPLDTADPGELRNRLHTLESLVSRAPVPIAVAHDAECRFVTANAALSRLLGVPPGVNISLAPRPGEEPPYKIQRNGMDVPSDELPMQYAIAHRTRVSNDIEIVRADGTVMYVQNDVEPLYDLHGTIAGCVSVCVDLTERTRAEDLRRETDRRKDEFLATLSHELRSPLALIRDALDVLQLAGDDDTRRIACQTMQRQLQQLVRLTDDLLDVSRMTRNRIDLRRQRLDLRSAVHSALETTQPLIDAAAHRLICRLPDEPLWVEADLTRIAQAFANLLHNAVKYTGRGGRITIHAVEDQGTAVVLVRDTGVGISPQALPRIFDMFAQLDESIERAEGGLGIGLTLARRLIELHGGTIEASSAGAGRGSTFVVRLPLSAAAGDAVTPAAAPTGDPVTPRRILIAEDIPDAAEMLRVMLERMGHDVRVAADGVQAVALAKEYQPDVALLDIGMPRMDGYQAAREIRAALGPDVRLVALTGWGQEEDQRRAREAGFDHHLTKPAEPETLERLLLLSDRR
ncbi:MAG: response regulator [Acidimicrobiia bacterium]|nr:response regulator [Acidimicrobiia bacterium]